jgi:aspartate 1-decarboxylase
MTVTLFKGKLHRLTVTEADLYYEGSITLDEELLEAANILPYERVQVVNVNNGARLETYTIPSERGARVVCLNGPAARLCAPGDEIIVIAYADMTPEEARTHRPRVVLVNKRNDPTEVMDLDGTPITEPNAPGVTDAVSVGGLDHAVWAPRWRRSREGRRR